MPECSCDSEVESELFYLCATVFLTQVIYWLFLKKKKKPFSFVTSRTWGTDPAVATAATTTTSPLQ